MLFLPESFERFDRLCASASKNCLLLKKVITTYAAEKKSSDGPGFSTMELVS